MRDKVEALFHEFALTLVPSPLVKDDDAQKRQTMASLSQNELMHDAEAAKEFVSLLKTYLTSEQGQNLAAMVVDNPTLQNAFANADYPSNPKGKLLLRRFLTSIQPKPLARSKPTSPNVGKTFLSPSVPHSPPIAAAHHEPEPQLESLKAFRRAIDNLCKHLREKEGGHIDKADNIAWLSKNIISGQTGKKSTTIKELLSYQSKLRGERLTTLNALINAPVGAKRYSFIGGVSNAALTFTSELTKQGLKLESQISFPRDVKEYTGRYNPM